MGSAGDANPAVRDIRAELETLLANGGTTHQHIELLVISKVRRITAALHGSVHATDHTNHRARMPKPYFARSASPLPELGPVPGGAQRARKVVLAA